MGDGMNRRALLGMVLATALLAGCSAGSRSPSGTTPSSQATGAASPAGRGQATYTALAPEGAEEIKAVANIGKSYDFYLKTNEVGAQANPGLVVYRDGRKVKPIFIGYQITGFSDKLDNGKYNMTTLLVLDGNVTSNAAWEQSGDMTLADINPAAFVFQVPLAYTQPMKATTQRQKDAVAKAKAWLSSNFPDKKLNHVELTSIVFTWGQPGDKHGLLLDVNPNIPQMIGASAR
jgi:hypothetical protein